MILVPIGTLTIAINTSESAAVDVVERAVMAIQMPAAWDAAALTFECAPEKTGTFQNVYKEDGTEYSVTTAAGRWVVVQPILTAGIGPWLKVRSGTSGAAVNQTAARTIVLWGRDLR